MQYVENIKLSRHSEGVVLPVKAVPGASRDRVVGVLGDRLKVAVSAAAEKGRANKAIARVLARALGPDVADVRLLRGQTNPNKEFLVTGVDLRGLEDILKHL